MSLCVRRVLYQNLEARRITVPLPPGKGTGREIRTGQGKRKRATKKKRGLKKETIGGGV